MRCWFDCRFNYCTSSKIAAAMHPAPSALQIVHTATGIAALRILLAHFAVATRS